MLSIRSISLGLLTTVCLGMSWTNPSQARPRPILETQQCRNGYCAYITCYSNGYCYIRPLSSSPRSLRTDEPSPNRDTYTNGMTTQNQYNSELLKLTNAQRHKQGLPSLQFSSQLAQAAQLHAQDMAKNNFLSHTGSNGSQISNRARAVGYNFSYIGENIARGSSRPAAIIQQWMNSPGHRRNILKSQYTEVGFGYARDPYGHYWVQVFGRRSN